MTLTSSFLLVCTAVGGAVLAKCLYSIISFLTFHFLPFGSNSLEKYQRSPRRAWAVVTGSSAGIGLGCAQELAGRGFGVIILAHKANEVDAAVTTIKAEFPDAAVEKVVLDAAKANYGDIQAALAPFLDLPITVLVNNVAVQTSTPTFTHFESYRPVDIANSINANNLFLCNITHVLYPVLSRRNDNTSGNSDGASDRSLVISISSGGHLVALPWLTVYNGTKAFVSAWSRSMSRESSQFVSNNVSDNVGTHTKIDHLSIIPGDVRTQANIHGAYPRSPTGRQFAAMFLDRVGRAVSWDRAEITPYWLHEVQMWAATSLPERVAVPAVIADMENRRRLEAEARRKDL